MSHHHVRWNIMSFILVCTFCITTFFSDACAVTYVPTRQINVVYDDSGSMYNGGSAVWCQAKYAMESFCAMLGQKDTMHVFYLSDFQSVNTEKEVKRIPPRLRLYGRDGAEVNVRKVHNEKTRPGNTPSSAIYGALMDLYSITADEKWLVVLTDGEFGSMDVINSWFSAKPDDVKVVFLGIGKDASSITANADAGIFYEKAASGKEILNKITTICTRIYNFNRLNVTAGKITFDVPMKELIVFAQGKNVAINGINNTNGTPACAAVNPVQVKYSECDATNANNKPDTSLRGQIAVYTSSFDAGTYQLDVTDADTIEVYYKPDLEIAATITNVDGLDTTGSTTLPAGDYIVSFYLVKAGTTDRVPDSKLLSNLKYTATMSSNGSTQKTTFSSGDTITLTNGTLTIDVTATFLEYNTVSTSLQYDVLRSRKVTFTPIDNQPSEINSDGLLIGNEIHLQVLIDGQAPTDAEWSELSTPQIYMIGNARNVDVTIQKSADKGIIVVSPTMNGMASGDTYSTFTYGISMMQYLNGQTVQGVYQGKLAIQDHRSLWEQKKETIFKFGAALFLLIIVIGYTPLGKKRLPKKLKRSPVIRRESTALGNTNTNSCSRGEVRKHFLSVILPYTAQKADIRYVPKTTTGCPILKVCACKGKRMQISNLKDFRTKDNIIFDGECITKDTRYKKLSSGTVIVVSQARKELRYTCILNR